MMFLYDGIVFLIHLTNYTPTKTKNCGVDSVDFPVKSQ